MARDQQRRIISVIIVNWNTRELLDDCLRSVVETAGALPCEIIVVDNASSDGSAAAIRDNWPAVKLIASATNLGFAAANNRGLEIAQGEFVLFLNSDTVVLDDALEEMRAFLSDNPNAGAVGCRLLNADRCTTQTSYWSEYPSCRWLLAKTFYLEKLRAGQSAPEADAFPVAHLLGACIMSRMSTIREIGGFDESYFLYLEETDLCYRLSERGYAIYHLPRVSIVHLGQQSSSQAAEWTNVHLLTNTYRFIREHQATTVLSRWAIQGITCMYAMVRILLWTIRFVIGLPSRKMAGKMVRGYWALLKAAPQFERKWREHSV